MDVIAEKTTTQTVPNQQSGLTLSGEVIAVLVLVVLSVLLRVAQLGEVPIDQTEARDALAAWRSIAPEAPGTAIIADSPTLFWAQRISFTFLGGTELAARILTALAGVALGLSPLLFRDLLGRPRAYVFALLLSLAPTMIAASRFGSPVVWALLFAVIGLWALWRYWNDERQTAYGIGAVIAFGAVVLLAEPGGPLLMLMLAFAALLALAFTTLAAPTEEDLPGDDYLTMIGDRLRGFPLLTGSGAAALVAAAVSTGFMLSPSGLSMIGETLSGFISGFGEANNPGDPVFLPLIASLYYDTFLWVLAAVATYFLIQRDENDLIERFLMGWVAAAVVASLLFRGGQAAHSLWLLVPLAGLVSYLIADVLSEGVIPLFWVTDDEDFSSALWGRWLLVVIMFGFALMVTIHFQIVARGFLLTPDGSLAEFIGRLDQAPLRNTLNSIIWLVISLLFIAVGYFLAASIWGNWMAGRGVLLGIVAFVLISGAGTGWRVSVSNATNPVEVWHTDATDADAEVLRLTLQDFAFRETSGFPALPMAILAEDDGVVAWLVRDFVNARFIDDINEGFQEQMVLLPQAPQPGTELDLGASYVGQNFVITRTWSAEFLEGFDFMAWWAVQRTRFQPVPAQKILLWVRQDVYDSNPFEPSN